MKKKNKIIMWQDENTGRYYGCEVIKGYRVAFGNNMDECLDNIEPEVYEKAAEAKGLANKIVSSTGMSALVLHVTKYRSVLENQVKEKKVEVVHMIMGKNEKKSIRENLVKN